MTQLSSPQTSHAHLEENLLYLEVSNLFIFADYSYFLPQLFHRNLYSSSASVLVRIQCYNMLHADDFAHKTRNSINKMSTAVKSQATDEERYGYIFCGSVRVIL